MPSRRFGNWLGFLACIVALSAAFYSQYVLEMQPCHLCIFQRVTVAAMGVAFLFAALHSNGRLRGAIYAGLIAMTGLATLVTSGRHVWIQMQPPGSIASCGADLDFMLELFPVTEVIMKVFKAGGECAKVDFTLLGLSMPAWVFVFALVVTVGGVWINLRTRA
ncbi:MAG: disulfide bond formation protein B [Gammaproteobacteria bacterium]|nr:disulfide bond formation protein B [Gammaproteobacteria bacterium]